MNTLNDRNQKWIGFYLLNQLSQPSQLSQLNLATGSFLINRRDRRDRRGHDDY